MPDSRSENAMGRSTASSVQLSLPIGAERNFTGIAPPSPRETDEEWEIVAAEPPIEVQQRLKIIQTLISAQGTERYGKLQ